MKCGVEGGPTKAIVKACQGVGGWVVWFEVRLQALNRYMLIAPFTKKRTHNLGS